MASLYVTEMGYLITQGSVTEAYELLSARGYLSEDAESEPERVIAHMEQVSAAFQASPKSNQFGQERWRDVEAALEEAGYLSERGLTRGKRFVNRDGTRISKPDEAGTNHPIQVPLPSSTEVSEIDLDQIYPGSRSAITDAIALTVPTCVALFGVWAAQPSSPMFQKIIDAQFPILFGVHIIAVAVFFGVFHHARHVLRHGLVSTDAKLKSVVIDIANTAGISIALAFSLEAIYR